MSSRRFLGERYELSTQINVISSARTSFRFLRRLTAMHLESVCCDGFGLVDPTNDRNGTKSAPGLVGRFLAHRNSHRFANENDPTDL